MMHVRLLGCWIAVTEQNPTLRSKGCIAPAVALHDCFCALHVVVGKVLATSAPQPEG